jgi:hypothetical protein
VALRLLQDVDRVAQPVRVELADQVDERVLQLDEPLTKPTPVDVAECGKYDARILARETPSQ